MATVTKLTDFAAGLIGLLCRRAREEPNKEIFKFLTADDEVSAVTCAQLHRRACTLALLLRQHAAVGERVLLLYPPGLDYVVSFFGCLYAGLIPVPSYPPARATRDIRRSSAWTIAADARPAVILATEKILQRLAPVQQQFSGNAVWLAPDLQDETQNAEWRQFEPKADGIAYLQYTSGSTTKPRGVMVSHANLMHNAEHIHSAFGLSSGLTAVFWLPPYHDMGLIGGILQPVFSGFTSILMSPGAFIQRPALWLETISSHRAAVSGGPNFAYDLCVRRFNPAEIETLDLSCWKIAFNGAEPVRAGTLRNFVATFAAYGFRETAFQACYGLAEATLLVSGRKQTDSPVTLSLDSGALSHDRVEEAVDDSGASAFVGCGLVEEAVEIVKPGSSSRCTPGEIGEILVSGAGVAQGYWEKPEESEQVFQARVERSPAVFLRTGDLGFIRHGELFITGRLKDLIIIRGRNYYPADIEDTVRGSFPALADKSCAALSMESEGETHLLVLQECSRKSEIDAQQVFSAIRAAVASTYQLQVHTIALVVQGGIPKTTSGKMQRNLCLKQFSEGALPIIASSTLPGDDDELQFTSLREPVQAADQNEIVQYLLELIARKLGVAKSHIDPRQPLEMLGLDSLLSIQIAMEVENHFGTVLPPATFLDSMSIEEVALRLPFAPHGQVEEDSSDSETGVFPLSHGQRAIWFLQQLAPAASAYNIARAFRLKGSGLGPVLRSAIQECAGRHPSLGARFTMSGSEPMQQFHPARPPNFVVVDGRSWSEPRLKKELVDGARQPFALESDALLRVTWIEQPEEAGVLLIVVHHIVADRWSLEILLEDIAASCRSAELRAPGRISAYLDWQSKFVSSAEGGRLRSYWEEKLGGELPVLNLATGRRPRTQTFNGARLTISFEQQAAHLLAELARRENVTLFVLLFAAFDALLYRYTGKTDLPVGIPVAGRSRAAHARIVGYLVNAIVVRADLSQAPTFRSLVQQLRRLVIEGVNHADYPFSLLIQHLQPERDPSLPPLFQVLIYAESLGKVQEDFRLAGIEAEPVEIAFHPAQFDLSLRIEESAGLPLTASFDYNTDLFDEAMIRRMATHFSVLLEDLAARPGLNLSQAALLTDAEQSQLLRDWSGGNFVGQSLCVHQLVELQCERAPHAEAIIYGEERLTYGELNVRANCLAWELSAAGAAPEVRVAVCVERSSDLIVALLAVLKSGAAYVPLDPAYPPEFLSQVLRESKAEILLTQEVLLDRFPAQSATVVCLENCDFSKDVPALKTAVIPENLAYIIFTSGSTGTPKGVAIEHRNCAAFLQCAPDVYPLTAKDVVLSATSICFDISIIEIFLTLARGAKIAIAFNVLELPSLPAREEVTLVDTVPSGMAQLLSYGPLPSQVSTVSLGGEALGSDLVKSAYASGVQRVVNIYGPTEDTTFSTFECVPPEEIGEPTIGRPLRGKHTYILDAAMNLCPVGVTGEVYVGGTGVVRGYWGQPSLTAERFVPNPFSLIPGARLYRVGDLGRWRADSRLEYLGRADFQVKVRGFRIELGDIESALRSHAAVQQAVVVVHGRTNSEKQLVAYVVLRSNISAQDLRGFIRERLPEYMIPTRILELETLPLNPNGKINRKALPDPDSLVREGEEYASVRSATEQAVAAIWAEVLGVEVSDRQANFFESGGHSLLATQATSRIRQLFGVDLPLSTIFEEPTLGGLSARVERLRTQGRAGHAGLVLAARNRPEKVPLSHAQQRMWFLEQMQPGDPTYVIAAGIWLRGSLNVEALRLSLNKVVERHEALRTRMEMQDGMPCQVISDSLELEFPVANLTTLEKEQRAIEARRQLKQMVETPFDLARGPLVRAHLWKLDDQENCLGLTLHHIVADGWSMGLLFREIKEFYEALATGARPNLRPLAVQYADYAIWQREWLQLEELDRQLEYWRAQLQDISGLRLPIDRPYPPVRSGYGVTYRWSLPAELVSDLKALSQKQGVTLFMTMLGAFQALLARYNGNGDITTGSVIANRNRREIEDLIGFFVNTVVLRAMVKSWQSFEDLLAEVRRICLEAYAHQDLPFEKLVEALQPERDLGRQPFFQALLALQNAPLPQMEMAGVKLSPEAVESSRSRFDLTLMVEPLGETWTVVTEYNTDIFEQATIERISRHYRRLLQQVVSAAGVRLSELSILEESEQKQLLAWSGGEQPCEGIYLHQFFEKQAEKTPNMEAVVLGQERLSYAELNRRANQLAHYLRALGAGPEMVVGLCVERSLNMVAGMLGILKAGAVYLPLEPTFPVERLSYMIQDSGAQIVVTQSPLKERLRGTAPRLVVLDEMVEMARQPQENPLLISGADPENLAYIIYTSGSTGRPKGVGVSHRSVCPLIDWGERNVSLTSQDRVVQYLAFGFDWSIWEIMIAVSSGATLFLMAEKSHLATERVIQENRITVLHATPTEVEILAANGYVFDSLRTVLVGGEKSDWYTLECIGKLAGEDCRVFNMYGPTEAAIVTVADTLQPRQSKAHDQHENIPIGFPLANTTCFILDADLNLCAQGVIGELYLGGIELARGYIGQPSLTAEKFLPDPFAKSAGARLYKTGDLSRWRMDGRLDYLGRADHQVKIRGFRIELGEIESIMRSHPAVREATVIVNQRNNGDKRLVAYVVANMRIGQELRAFLREHLPEYMVPSQVVEMESLPLSPNGKVNRKALPDPQIFEGDGHEVMPLRTATEEMVATLWSAVLGEEVTGREANFFELGGHSLLATQVVSRIRQAFGVELPLRTFFEETTLAQLSARIDRLGRQEGESRAPKLTAGRRPQIIPLSYAQQRMWFLEQIEPGGPVYVIVAAVRLTGHLEVEALKRSLNQVLQRHEVLRTQIQIKDGVPSQEIIENVELPLDLEQIDEQIDRIDFSGMETEQRQVEGQRRLQEIAREGFDLGRAPLVRARLLGIGPQEHWLVFSMHHIASDGWSVGVLLRELKELYRAEVGGHPAPFEPLAVQYADYACWQREWLEAGEDRRQLEYWRKQLQDLEELRLPLDHPYPPARTGNGASYRSKMPESLCVHLRDLSRQQGVTYFMALLAGMQALLSRYSGQSDIVIGTVIANRNRQEIEGLIGFFANTVLLRSEITGNQSFRQLLATARDVSLQAYMHQDLPFEKLVEALHPDRDPRRQPLVQVMLAFQNAPFPEMELGALKLEPLNVESERARFDLTIDVQPHADGWKVGMEYNTDIFDAATIERLASHYCRLLEAAVVNPEALVSDLEILTPGERHQLESWSGCERGSGGNERHDQSELCLPEMFRQQVQQRAAAEAVCSGAQSLSYQELNHHANVLARRLRTAGAGQETIVGICIDRSLEEVIATLATLKAGGCCLSLDPADPEERLNARIAAAKPHIIVAQRKYKEKLAAAKVKLLVMEEEYKTVAQVSDEDLDSKMDPDNLAYVVYTSSYRGVPQAIAISHRNIGRLAGGNNSNNPVWELWSALLRGGRLVISDHANGAPDAFHQLIDSHQIRVLDFHGNLTPIGVPGEIHAGGDALARGYIGSPELTADRFIPDSLSAAPGKRLYKTGELARWRADGTLEYLGRLDRQLEVHGIRLDPAEIESALCRHATVRQALVLEVSDHDGRKKLVAYLVPSGNLRPDLAELRSYLEKYLPAVMRPEDLVWLDALPFTAKGKLDLRALPDPAVAAQKALGWIPPRNPDEIRISDIWGEVLGRTGFGVFENFFDVGGTSLQVVLVVSKLRQAFSQQIPVTSLFAYPTIASMAEHLGTQKSVAAAATSEVIDSRKQAMQQQQELRLRARSRGTEGTA